MFNAKLVSYHALILKTNCMLLSWFSAASECSQAKLEDSMAIVRRGLNFLGLCSEGTIRQ